MVARNLERRAKRRAVLAGYPIEPRAMNRAEIAAYLSGDKIVCLLCGKAYATIGVHLRNIHALTVDDYRLMYGLPWRAGLAGRANKEAHRVFAKEMVAAGTFVGGKYKNFAHAAKHRKPQPFFREVCMANLSSATKRTETFKDDRP